MKRFSSIACGVAVLSALSLVACGGSSGNEEAFGNNGEADSSSGDESGGDETGVGLNPDVGGSESLCTPKTCAEAGANCGPIGDGCGGFIECGTCTAPETCGGGGKPSTCGKASCTAKTCAELGAKCGPQGDGCGGLLDCGSCPAGETCGGGGVPNECGKGLLGDGGVCKPKTCVEMGLNCGPVSDGCGTLINCGTCTVAGEICGGGGKGNVCGGGTSGCVKKTCLDYGANCGAMSDGCGALIPGGCGTCTAPAICGGGGKPNVCGGGTPVCTGLACDMPTCAAGTTTSVSGTVRDPAGKVPLYNVNVYVPNAAVKAFVDGASCDKCADALSGSPIAQTVTGVDGKFKLTGLPVPATGKIPLVIQVGKWRRQVTVNVTKCVDTPITDVNLTRLPRNKAEGNIPKIALTTGSADPLECLLRKMGIDSAEFTNPSGTGRVNLFRGQNGASAYSSGTTYPTAQTALWNTVDNLKKYDVVLMACEGLSDGGLTSKPTTARQAMIDYTALGGRVFMTHYHGTAWLKNAPTATLWPTIATFVNDSDFVSPTTAKVNMTFPKGDTLATWLVNVGGSTTKGDLVITSPQHNIKSTNATYATTWVNIINGRDLVSPTCTTTCSDPDYKCVSGRCVIPTAPEYFTFNTPITAASTAQCGRVVVSDIHASSGDSIASFPSGCTTTNLSAQEKALEFMIFDLTSAVCDDSMPPPPPTCTKKTCAELGVPCGPAGDGCGGTLDCGSCTPMCTPKTCAEMGVTCGPSGDGCGGTLDCGMCPDGGACKPMTCGGRCGPQGDGCGGILACPPCDGGCTPTTCMLAGAECGKVPDGCGLLLDCGGCIAPATCDMNKCIGIK
jgi:hypothetical protein